jgi:hypothetical protein
MTPELPPGFVVDEAPSAALPQGFVIDPNHPVAGPSGDFLTDVGRRLGTAGATAAGALLSTPRSVAQGVDWLASKVGYHPGADAALAGIKDPTGSGQPAFPDFQTARDMAFNTTGGTEYQPATWLGRRTQDALTGLAMGATGNFRAIPAAMGGSATGGAAAEAFPNHPLAAAMLGFIPGAAAANMAVSAPQRLVSTLASKPNVEPYAAFDRLGLPTQLSGTTTGEPGLVYAEKLAARMPGSEGAVADARNRLTAAWQDKLASVADSLGSATTPTEVGTSLQGAANNWLSNFKTNTGKLWNDYYSKVPPSTPYAVPNYEGALKSTLGSFPGAPATGGILQPGTLKNLSDALGVDLKAGGGALPAETVHAMRTAIGEKLANPQTIADTSQAALKQLYGGLSEDIKAGAGGVSPEALTAFHKANAATAAGHDLLETHLDPILRAASPEQAAQYAMSQARLGGSRLGALTLNLPSAAGDLGSYALRNTATNIESPTAMANAMLGRKPALSQEAQRVLFPNAATQQDIADLAATGRAMQPLEKDLNNSPTATHSARGPGRLIAAAELARQGHEIAGVPGAVGGGLVGMFAPNVAGKLAQATALNPYLSALYGRNIPIQPGTPSRLARAIMAPALGAPGSAEVPARLPSSVP